MPGRLQLHKSRDSSPVGLEESVQGSKAPKNFCLGVCHHASNVHHSQVVTRFLCSQRANGRLGLKGISQNLRFGIPYPIEVKIPGSRIVSLVAGGM